MAPEGSGQPATQTVRAHYPTLYTAPRCTGFLSGLDDPRPCPTVPPRRTPPMARRPPATRPAARPTLYGVLVRARRSASLPECPVVANAGDNRPPASHAARPHRPTWVLSAPGRHRRHAVVARTQGNPARPPRAPSHCVHGQFRRSTLPTRYHRDGGRGRSQCRKQGSPPQEALRH